MADLRAIIAATDELSPIELDALYQHIMQRRHAAYWLVAGENLRQIQQIVRPVNDQAELMDETEVNATIDEALAEVRRERKTYRSP